MSVGSPPVTRPNFEALRMHTNDPKRTLRLCFSAHGKSSARRLHHMAPQIRQMLRHHFVELIKALRRYLLNNVLGQARFSAFSAKIGVSRSYFNPLFSLLDF